MTKSKLNMLKPPFPAINLPAAESREAEAYFTWFLKQLPERMAFLRERYAASGNQSDELDFSPESLKSLWVWFCTKKLLPNQEAELQQIRENLNVWLTQVLQFHKANRYSISGEQFFIALDLAIYFLEVLRQNNPSLQWQIGTSSPVTKNENQPVLAGFQYGVQVNPWQLHHLFCLYVQAEPYISEDELYLFYESYLDNLYGKDIPLGRKVTWGEQAHYMKSQSYPATAELIPELLEWLRDINWPGAMTIAEYVRELGEPLLEYLPEVFSSNDDIWIGWLRSEVIAFWPEELQQKAEEIGKKYGRFTLEQEATEHDLEK
ncbi:DUF5071 domain-containing protein [Brevibacillus parabrevis]|uniref:DUF5071 domain-containing protein n=1 Tax=Brevibacillus parabrevis TaxID=54914 RepID=UPI0028D736E0|nr:DUF5071 domain-containing protein [Brevibacillus parabrevis]